MSAKHDAVLVSREVLAELQRDAARLDALVQMMASVYVSRGSLTHTVAHWVVVDETKRTRTGSLGRTLRDAIDNAMMKHE